MRHPISVKDPAKGKSVYVGYVEDGVFYVKRTKAEHLMEIYQGYGVQVDAFHQATRFLASSLCLTVTDDESQSFCADFSVWHQYGHLDDLGNGPQLFLGKHEVSGPKTMSLKEQALREIDEDIRLAEEQAGHPLDADISDGDSDA